MLSISISWVKVKLNKPSCGQAQPLLHLAKETFLLFPSIGKQEFIWKEKMFLFIFPVIVGTRLWKNKRLYLSVTFLKSSFSSLQYLPKGSWRFELISRYDQLLWHHIVGQQINARVDRMVPQHHLLLSSFLQPTASFLLLHKSLLCDGSSV